MATEESK